MWTLSNEFTFTFIQFQLKTRNARLLKRLSNVDTFKWIHFHPISVENKECQVVAEVFQCRHCDISTAPPHPLWTAPPGKPTKCQTECRDIRSRRCTRSKPNMGRGTQWFHRCEILFLIFFSSSIFLFWWFGDFWKRINPGSLLLIGLRLHFFTLFSLFSMSLHYLFPGENKFQGLHLIAGQELFYVSWEKTSDYHICQLLKHYEGWWHRLIYS